MASPAAATHFGSGWGWLVKDSSGALSVTSTHDAGCPLTDGLTPLITVDVWEHAYYVDYRNARGDYLAGWWELSLNSKLTTSSFFPLHYRTGTGTGTGSVTFFGNQP